MKKILSFMLTVAMLMSVMTFNVTKASAAVHGEYTAIDLTNSSAVTSKAFLSEATAGTITDAQYPDFFMGNGIGKAYAVSKESMDKLLVDGTITYKGIPFKVNSADNQKVAIGCTGNKVQIPAGNYSKIHVLLVGSPDYTGDNTIYRGAITTSGVEIGTNRTADEFVADLEWAKVTPNDDFTGKDKPKLVMQTYEINDKTQVFDRVSFWMNSDASRRIIAVTVEGLSGNDITPIITQKLASLPEADSYTGADYSVYAELDKLIQKAKADGVDLSAIAGIEKYYEIKEKIQALTDSCVPVNLTNSSAVTSKAYLSEATAGTITDATYPDFFMTGSAGTPYAISKESMDKLLTDGAMTYKGIPFNVNTADNKKVAIGSTGNKVQIPVGNYSKVHVLYAGSDSNYITIYRSVLTPSGTEVGINRIADEYVADLEWAKVTPTDDISGRANPKLKMQTYEITNTTLAYDRISFWIESNAPIRILAVTVEGLSGEELAPIIPSKIAALSDDVSAVTEEALKDITVMLAKAQKAGVDVTTIEGYSKYNRLMADKYNCYEPIDVTAYFNAIGYVSAEKAGTYSPEDESIKYPHFFKNSGGAATSPMALSSEAIKELAPNGIATLKNVPYYLSAPADGQNGVIKANSQVIDVPDGYYAGVKLLSVYNPTGGGDNTFYNNYYTVSGGEVKATKSESQAGRIKRAKVLTTDAEPADVSLVDFTYEFNDKTKEMDSVKIWQQSETVIRVLAVTMITLKGNEWNPVIESEIAALPEDVSEVDAVKFNELTALIDKAESCGMVREVISGIDKYERLKAELEAMDGVADFTVSYENDDITVDVTFESEIASTDITKENIVLTCGRDAVDYTVTAVGSNGAKIDFKNEMTTKDSYQLVMNIDGKCKFDTIFTVAKPITTENVLLKNSQGEIVDRVLDVTDGKITFTADVKNNTFKQGKAVNIVTAIYNNGTLYAAKITPVTIDFEGTYQLNAEMTVPTEGLNENWTTSAFVWSDDIVTPLVKKSSKTYGIDALNDPSKDIKVAFIGGSITEGRNYTDPFVEKWQADRTGKITMLNAGIGGTTSSYGTMRLYEDVLSKKPDIVFVEFTLNDVWLNEAQTKKNVESMIRQCYERDHQPVISFIIIPDRRTNSDGTYQIAEKAGYYATVANYYGLTPFNAHQLMVDAINDGGYTWDSFVANGNVHPDKTQGENIATVMYNDFKENFNTYVKNIAWNPQKGFGSDTYSEPAIISSAKASYDSKWENSKVDGVVTEGYGVPTSLPFESFMASGTKGAKMTFKFSGTKILISSLMGKLGKSATYTITNDDGEIEKAGSMSTYIADYSWYENIILTVEGLEDTNHTLTVTVGDGSGLFGLGEFWIDE